MTKSIRKEIEKTMEWVADLDWGGKDAPQVPTQQAIDKWASLFRSWALECVGEAIDNKHIIHADVSPNQKSWWTAWREGYNQAKKEISEKIEEENEK